MEVSLLQHAKDKAPQRVTVDELVEQLKNDSWPTGYQPLAVLGAVVEGGYGKEQQIRYYGKVQHFGMDYYARLTGCEADRTLVGVIPPEERKRHAVSLAYDAMIKKRKSNASSEQTDTPDQPDTPDAF